MPIYYVDFRIDGTLVMEAPSQDLAVEAVASMDVDKLLTASNAMWDYYPYQTSDDEPIDFVVDKYGQAHDPDGYVDPDEEEDDA